MPTINAVSTWKVFFKDPTKASAQAVKMAENLLENIIKPLLPAMGGSCVLSSGARTMDDIKRLEAQGYHPSKTSDHLFGLMEPTAGAGDIIPACGPERFFDWVKKNCNPSAGTITAPSGAVVRVGQVILEKNRTSWIHLSNPRKLFWPTAAGVPTLLVSLDNGKTYQRV